MGIYSELQKDLKSAFDTDLADAVRTLTITDKEKTGYDPVTGSNQETDSTFEMRCILLQDRVGEKEDEPTTTDHVKVLVLDSEKTVPSFELDMEMSLDGSSYKIVTVVIDPARATHTIKGRKY